MGTTTEPAKDSKTLNVRLSTKAVEGERTVVAVVSSANFDRDYERVDVRSLRLPLKGGGHVAAKDLTGNEPIDIPMLINHSFDVEDVIGSVRKAYLNQLNELVVEFGISRRAKAQDLMQLIDEQHLDNAFSITMNDYDYADSTIYDAEIVEISLVFRGSNKDARLLQVKSLIKGDSMAEAKDTAKAKLEAEIEAKRKELAQLEETPAEPTPAEPQEPVAPEAPAEPQPDKDVEPAPKPDSDPAPAPEAPKPTKTVKETPKMSDNIVTDEVKPKAAPAPEQKPVAIATKDLSNDHKNEIRKAFMEGFLGMRAGKPERVAEANKKAMELRGVKSKEITYANGDALYQDEVVANDILEAYTQYGNVGRLVNRVDILGAEKWKRVVEADGTGFAPVGLGGTKDEDEPVWTSITVTPHEHAMVVAWYDAIARRTPIAVYQQIVRYIAKSYGKLEDKIVLTYAGATVDGEVFESTGLVPALEAAGGARVVAAGGTTSAEIAAALGTAYGNIQSDGQATIVANRSLWGRLAVAVDANGNTVFNVVGNQVQAGALGTFNVVVSQQMPDDKAIVGVWPDYDLVTRGAMETFFSREATVGSFNLFMQDGSALRANIDISGKASRLTSFVEIDFTDAS